MRICTNRDGKKIENDIAIVNENLPLTESVNVIICTNAIRKEKVKIHSVTLKFPHCNSSVNITTNAIYEPYMVLSSANYP